MEQQQPPAGPILCNGHAYKWLGLPIQAKEE